MLSSLWTTRPMSVGTLDAHIKRLIQYVDADFEDVPEFREDIIHALEQVRSTVNRSRSDVE